MSEEQSREDFRSLLKINGKTYTQIFSEQVESIFSGVSGITWIDDPLEITTKLKQFFDMKLVYENDCPVCWWRGSSNSHIRNFIQIGENKFLMNQDELIVSRLAIFNGRPDDPIWIYLEMSPDKPTGVYEHSEETSNDIMNKSGFFYEEYAVLDDGNLVTRSDYDYGYAMTNGEYTDVCGKGQVRCRYLSKYNFILAPKDSRINDARFDDELESYLNNILLDPKVFDDMVKAIQKL